MIFQELNYPRRKNFIKNLNILLETTPITSPSKSLTAKILNKSSNQLKVLKTRNQKDTNIIQVIRDNRLSPKKIVQLRQVNQQHKLKVKQNLKRRYSQSAHIRAQSSRDSFMKQQKNFYDLIQSSGAKREIYTQGHWREKQMVIFHEDENAKSKAQQYQGMIIKSQFLSKTHSYGKDQNLYQSIEIKRNSQGLLYDYKPKEIVKKQYLKKGQRIKSTIIQNLIKSKLIKKHEQLNPLKKVSTMKAQEQIVENNEIIRLIKLFKGTYSWDIERKTRISQKIEQVLKKQNKNGRQKDPLHIQGWLNQSLQQEENDLDKKNLFQEVIIPEN